jgi:hypothetical protein
MPRFVASALAALALCSACYTNPDSTSSGGGGVTDNDAGGCIQHLVEPGTDLMTPKVSFRSDVMMVFVNSCAFSSCHSEDSPHVFLGSKTDATKNTTVRAGIVNVPSTDLPSMPYIAPGDPYSSFLMRKLDGDQCILDALCPGGIGCQTSMPQNLPLLDVPSRDVVRRWIAQGALDD